MNAFTLRFVNTVQEKIVALLTETERSDLFKLSQLEPNYIEHLVDEGFDLNSFTLRFVNTVQEKIVALLNETECSDLFKLSKLEPNHLEHLVDEGFNLDQIAFWMDQGLASFTKEEAEKRNFRAKDKYGRTVSSSGLYFPFTTDFGQLRLDTYIEKGDGKLAKYLTPLGAKSQARIPKGSQVVTEGAKDAAAGSLLGGIRTGAIAGVSHYRKALPKGSGLTILFDSDGWQNPSVFLNLFNAGKWLDGKIQLVPQLENYPKAGLCEYFKAGHTADDYKKLIESAFKPSDLLIEWGNRFADIPEKRISHAIQVALRLASEHLNEIEQDLLISNIKANCKKVTAKTLSAELTKQRDIVAKLKKKAIRKQAEGSGSEHPPEDLHPESFYRPICLSKNLEFEDCVTAQAFDGWVYRRQFGATEGDWRVTDAAFYQWKESLGYWQHQSDNKINSLIADAGEKAFKLKHSKEFGWQILKPYENNSSKESAFKYCRSRLERTEIAASNTHLRAFKNCVVDLRTGARMPHRKDCGLTSIIPYDYEPGKKCPEVFRQFVAESFGEDMLSVIRAFTSMFLDPTAPYGRFPHLIGKSGGGKGTLGRFWNSLFGEDGCSSGDFSNLSTAEGRHQYLSGKSVFSIPDVGGFVSGLRAFYELVDNGGMSGRALFNPVGYFKTWNCRFWVASVDHLQVENAGDGWSRRAYPIPVIARTVAPDPDLKLKLEAVKADVISWALAMPREERDRILLSPSDNERVFNLTIDAALYADSTKSFVDLCLTPTHEAGYVPNHLLHTWYVAYCREHGYTPLGMSKFISHLKTVLSRNFVERGWSPMVNGQRHRVSAHWKHLAPVPGAFVEQTFEIRDSGENPQIAQNPTWTCIKAKCEEGGLLQFEQFWNPPQPPHGGNPINETVDNHPYISNIACDNSPFDCNNATCKTMHEAPSGTSIPSDLSRSGSTVQAGSIFCESLKQRNFGGVQGGSTVQGIGSEIEKNQIATLERVEVEKSQTTVTEVGHLASKADSFNVVQDESIHIDLSELAQPESQELKIGGLFKVRRIEGTMLNPCVEWISGCKLVRLPNPPVSQYHVFELPDGRSIAVAEDDFEPEVSIAVPSTVEPIQLGDTVRFLNPSQLENSRNLENIDWTVKQILGNLVICVHNHQEKSFAIWTLRKSEIEDVF